MKIIKNKENIFNLRPLFDKILKILAKTTNIMDKKPDWWLFTKKTSKKTKDGLFYYKFSEIRIEDKESINIKHFIRFLSDSKERYSFDEIEESIKRIKINKIDESTNKKEKEKIEKNILKKEKQIKILDDMKKTSNRTREDYLVNDNLGVTPIIQHCLYSITEITNKYQNHKDFKTIVSKETVQTLHYQLKEIILWFGQVMEKIDEK